MARSYWHRSFGNLVYRWKCGLRRWVLRRFCLDLCPQCGLVVDYALHPATRCGGKLNQRLVAVEGEVERFDNHNERLKRFLACETQVKEMTPSLGEVEARVETLASDVNDRLDNLNSLVKTLQENDRLDFSDLRNIKEKVAQMIPEVLR